MKADHQTSILNRLKTARAAVGALNPIIVGGAMAFSSVSVVANSLRLYRFRAGS